MTSRRQYLVNIMWSWAGAVALIVNGLLVSPYLIRRLGNDQYGIWALGLSLIEYFWLIDLGVRQATIKLGAEYRALEKWDALNQLLSTAIGYSAAVGLLVMLLLSLNTRAIAEFFRITDPSFPLLVHVVSASWGLGLAFNMFGAGLEAFQRFDTLNHIMIASMATRSAALVLLVHFGYGIPAMSIAVFLTQITTYAALYVAFRRLYPAFRLSPGLITRAAGSEIWRYSRQMVSALASLRLAQSAIPSLIARFLPVANVTYYTVSVRVLEYGTDGIGRVGLTTTPRAADMLARGMRDSVLFLAQYANRYCLTLWLILATFLMVYAEPLFRIWINPDFAAHAAFLVPILLIGYTGSMAQFISSSILMAAGRYTRYSTSLLIETLAAVAGVAIVLPIWGLAGAAVVVSSAMFLNRCVNLARIFSREFGVGIAIHLRRTLMVPLAIGAVDVVLLWGVRRTMLPGDSWSQLIAAGTLNAIALGTAALLLVAEPTHRQLVLHTALARWHAFQAKSERAA
jgi:O-antigen/teichoic acid export membrane protein